MEKVLEYIKKKNEVRIRDIATQFNISWKEARNIIRKLERNRVIEKVSRGTYRYKEAEEVNRELLKERVLRYLEGQKVPQKLAYLSLILQVDKYKLSRVLKKLKEEGKIKHIKGGYYIHADYVEYEVGSGKSVIYKSPIMVHNLTLYYNCPKTQQITLNPCRRIGQTTLDEIEAKCIEIQIGGKFSFLHVHRIYRNKRTNWWEIDTEADLESMILPIHIQISEKDGKINLMTEASANPMTMMEYLKFQGWLKAKFPSIGENQWYVKKYDIGDDWKFIGMDTGKFKEMRFTQFSNAVIHIYKKQLKGSGEIVRREVQYHTKENVMTPQDLIEIMRGISSKGAEPKPDEITKVIENIEKSVVKSIKNEIINEIRGKFKDINRELDGVLKTHGEGLDKLVNEIKEITKLTEKLSESIYELNSKIKKLNENDNIIAEGVAELLREVRKKKEEELKRVEELDKQLEELERKSDEQHDDYYYS